MSHLITSVNTNNPNINGEISSGINDFQILCIGSDFANDGTYSFPTTYPRAFTINDEYLWDYKSGWFYNSITGATINTYSANWAKSFTLPAGDYICGFNVAAYTDPYTSNGGIRCSLTDGTTVYSSSNSSGRNSYAVYNAAKNHTKTRFTLSTSTTVYVNIDTEIGTALHIVTMSSFYIIKEG